MTPQNDAAALVAMNATDMAAQLDGVDLATLNAALAAENAREGGPRAGAVKALTAAISTHPEAVDVAQGGTIDKGNELSDVRPGPGSISTAPPRPPVALLSQLELRWDELKHFVRHLQGDADGEIGDVLTFVRSKIGD